MTIACEMIGGQRVLFVMAVDAEYGPHLRARFTPLLTGVGPIEAALATGMALQELQRQQARPDLVVSLGSAGSRICPLG
ncbi:MAG: 5'-methylthioadenosine/S-adenosylhomocysteine nucleosidase, partial [Sphingobium limneticum]